MLAIKKQTKYRRVPLLFLNKAIHGLCQTFDAIPLGEPLRPSA